MNLFGVGVLELAVIFLIAFLVMGPVKSIEMARSAGKLIGELRRTVNEMTAATDLTGREQSSASPSSQASSQTASSQTTSSQAQNQTPGPSESPPAGAVPTTGTGDGNEQQS